MNNGKEGERSEKGFGVDKLEGLSGVDTHFAVEVSQLVENLATHYRKSLPEASPEQIASSMMGGVNLAVDESRIAAFLREKDKKDST